MSIGKPTPLLLLLFFPWKQNLETNFNSRKTDNLKVIETKNQDFKTIDFSKYTLNTTDGKQTKLSLEKGKIYILDFWYLECKPCVKDHHAIAKYIKNEKNNNIEIIGMSIDRSKNKWTTYLKLNHYNWPNYNQFGYDTSLYKDLEIQLFPTYLVVNSNGDILHKSNRFNNALDFAGSTKF